MSYNSLKTTLAAAAVIGVGALTFSTHAEAYWRRNFHHRHVAFVHHRHVAFVPVASMSAPAPAGYGMNGGYGTCIKRDPVSTTRGWRSAWVIDCAGKGAGYGGTAYYGAPVAAVAPVNYGYAGYGYGGGPIGGLFGGLFGW